MSLDIVHLLCTTLQVALMYDEVHGHQLDPIHAYLIKWRVWYRSYTFEGHWNVPLHHTLAKHNLQVALMYDEIHGHQLDPINAYFIKERVWLSSYTFEGHLNVPHHHTLAMSHHTCYLDVWWSTAAPIGSHPCIFGQRKGVTWELHIWGTFKCPSPSYTCYVPPYKMFWCMMKYLGSNQIPSVVFQA